MQEKRKSPRLKEFNEVTIKVVSEIENIPGDKISYNYSEDISSTGTKIRGNILLPVDTLLRIDFKLTDLEKKISALGKIRWIKVIIEDKYYEAGVEFVDTPNEAIKILEDYITWKKKITDRQPFHNPLWMASKTED
jgi:hypothetical protein